MVQSYAEFMYQTGLVDELQRDNIANKSRSAVDLINEKKWLEATEVLICDLLLHFGLTRRF